MLANWGNALFELQHLPEALAALSRAVRFDATNFGAHYNRAVVLDALQRPAEALESYVRSAALNPDSADAHYGRGNALAALLRLEEAVAAFDRAAALQPTNADFHFNKALALLMAGDFRRGWPLYEWRWRTEAVAPLRRPFAQPKWEGDPLLRGKTVLLHAEQGYGDTLHFCRYAPMVAARGAIVLLEVQPAVSALLHTLDGVARVLSRGDPLPAFDLHCPLLSLPLAFGTTLDSVPATVPYLHADPARVARWRERLGPPVRPRVGVVWSGSGGIAYDQRSLSFEQFAAALPPGPEYVCLQKDIRPSDRAALAARADIRIVSDELTDFAETAALVSLLDVVVSSDTAAAHLAGALAKPLWLVLAFDPTWRWLVGRSDSPWYPTAKLYRQPTLGDWGAPLADIRRALSAL